jgi:hypothetical protein
MREKYSGARADAGDHGRFPAGSNCRTPLRGLRLIPLCIDVNFMTPIIVA